MRDFASANRAVSQPSICILRVINFEHLAVIGIDHAKYRLRARRAADKLPALGNLCAPHMTPFSKVLREKRDQRDLLQRDLAAAMGCDPSLISGLESGHRGAPGPDFLKRLADAL